MNKRKVGRTLSRTSDQRLALKRTMLTSLILHRRIETTLAKAKECRPFAEKMVTKAKKTSVKSKDQAVLRMLRKDLSEKATNELIVVAEGFASRNGGYTRIVKIGSRKSDSAPMAILEWVGDQGKAKEMKAAAHKKGEKAEIVQHEKKSKEEAVVPKKEEAIEPKKEKVSDKKDK